MAWGPRLGRLFDAFGGGASVPVGTRVLWLGLFSWVVGAVLPTLHRAEELGIDSLLLLALGPALLAGGLWLRRAYPRASAYTLLSGFPVALALCMSRFEHALSLSTFTPTSLLFCLVGLGAYAASASQLGAASEPARVVEHKPLGELGAVSGDSRTRLFGRWILGLVTLGACSIVVWGPWQTPAHFRQQWGEAAPMGAALTALAAGLLGASAVALVAKGLRAQRRVARRDQARLKNAARLVLTGLSFLVLYALLRANR